MLFQDCLNVVLNGLFKLFKGCLRFAKVVEGFVKICRYV